MKVFIAHSSNYDFRNELYLPIRQSELNKQHDFFLPQEKGPEPVTIDIIKNSNVLVAEVSYPSTGQGIELGWAYVYKVPIVYLCKKGNKVSNSIYKLSSLLMEYTDSKDMIEKLSKQLSMLQSSNQPL